MSTWALEVLKFALGRWSLSEDSGCAHLSAGGISEGSGREHLGAGGISEGSGCEHLGAGGLSKVTAKSQSVGTWKREVPECATWAREPQSMSTCAREASECEYLDAGVSAKSHSSSSRR